jgi:3-(3-hydroxy-phenyl)propionate hydroxylase
MRPAGRGALESLYFRYPQFEAMRAPEADGRNIRHAVVIVGAGPIGLTAALTLARYGVGSVVLERNATFNDGSRAICVARSSMHIFERIGVVQPFLDSALGWTRGRSYYGDSEIYAFEMPHGDHERYLPMYNLQQQYIEQFLYDAVARNPLIDVRWQSEVTALAQTRDGATLQVASPRGDYELSATHVLAADGARSALRRMLGLRLKGENYEGKYVIADVKMAHDYPTERRAFFAPKSNPDSTVLVHKQPHDIWRIDYQLRDGEDEEEAIQEATIRAKVQSILSDIGHTGAWDLEWWSIYAANTLCLDDYRHGCVTFIGDSAHIVPIFGVRGLNNGLADAHNIGWKLAYVLQGKAPAALLDSYTPERRGATLDVFANATKSTRFMTPPSRGWTMMRNAALGLAVHHDFAKRFADPRQMQPYTYADSPLSTASPRAGAAAANVQLSRGRHLLDLAGDGFTVIAGAETHLNDARLKTIDPHVRLIGLDDAAVFDADDNATIARAYGLSATAAVVLRPDLHIAATLQQATSESVALALKRALGAES